MNWQSRILGTCFMSIVQFLILTYFALKNNWISFQFSKNIIKRSLIFSIPLIPNIAAGWIAGFSDRIIMTFYGRLGEAGIYSVAASFTMLLYILNDAVTQVQGPLSLSGLTENKKDAKIEMQNFLIVFVGTMSVFYLGLSLFSKEILTISTDNQYHIAHKLISILGPIYIFSGVYRIFTVLITFHGMTWWISVAAIFQALVNILLNLIFIPVFGMYAAAYSTLISMFLYTCFIVWRVQLIDPLIIHYRLISKILFLIVFITVMKSLVYFYISLLFVQIIIKLALFLFSIVTIYLILIRNSMISDDYNIWLINRK